MFNILNANDQGQQQIHIHAGTVLETINSAGYTYMHVEEHGKKFWIAVNSMPVKSGDLVTFNEQMWVEKFHSKTLGRTFDSVMFASDARTSTSIRHPALHQAATTQPRKIGPVEKLSDGYTVEELLLQGSTLKGKKVKVRAIVTKVSIGIMKRNWIHLEDGSGGDGTDDIVFTTTGKAPQMGSTVIAEGILTVDKDFGFGYFYPVIVEDATFRE